MENRLWLGKEKLRRRKKAPVTGSAAAIARELKQKAGRAESGKCRKQGKNGGGTGYAHRSVLQLRVLR